MKRFIFVLILPWIYSCQMESKSSSEQDLEGQSTSIPDSLENSVELKDTIINLIFQAGESLSTRIEKPYQRIHVEVPVVQTDSLIGALILPGENRNVYFSQVMMPDKQTDGPFGPNIRFETKTKGIYTLIIGPNTRAEGNALGEVVIKIDLK